ESGGECGADVIGEVVATIRSHEVQRARAVEAAGLQGGLGMGALRPPSREAALEARIGDSVGPTARRHLDVVHQRFAAPISITSSSVAAPDPLSRTPVVSTTVQLVDVVLSLSAQFGARRLSTRESTNSRLLPPPSAHRPQRPPSA